MTGRAVPWAFTVEKFMNKEEYKDCLRLLCDFDAISDKAERVNITLPSRVLRKGSTFWRKKLAILDMDVSHAWSQVKGLDYCFDP